VHFERFESALWQTSSLLLVAESEAVVIDPCISADEVAWIAGRAATLGARVTHVLVTHADWDHVCGIAAFPLAVAAMGAATAFVVETIALPGHTADGTAYRIRELDLLAVGDHLSAAEFPFVSSTSEYRTTLAGLVDLLETDPPAHVVPGHGPALTAAEALAIAAADLAYLRALRDAVADARDDRARARAAATAVAPPRPAPEDLAELHATNVEAQLEELLP
jgi:glyoxylase-like metal-dependent hydrolase (beta-lactamase superfamily II)